MEPIYTIVLATILLGETLSPVQMLGGALVICGVIVAETGPPSRPALHAGSGYRGSTQAG